MAATQPFSPWRITDDLAALLEVLPAGVRQALASPARQEGLLEVVLDLGRSPEARYPGRALMLGTRPVERADLAAVVERLGAFGGDNRAGIERTLHRISAIRNRSGEVVGLTCRVGRAVFGTVAMVRDLLDSGDSLLLMGRPGVGKTTALREIARVLADELERRVVVIDTSNEIAGDGDIPHPAIGRARRMQVARPELQHQVMIEAVENHMPEVIVIDEIGTELEARAARTIAERGVMLVATAHGNELANLIRNPTLSDLVGGIQSVTLGDEEARRRGSQKTVLERRAEPTFPLAVEIRSRSRWLVHTDVARTVDGQLRGQPATPQVRELDAAGLLRVEQPLSPGLELPPRRRPLLSSRSSVCTPFAPVPLPDPLQPPPHRRLEPRPSEERLSLYCCGVSDQLLDQVVRSRRWPVERVAVLEQADGVLALRRQLGRDPEVRRLAQQLRLPILVIKTDTLPQILRGVERLLRRSREPLPAPVPSRWQGAERVQVDRGLPPARIGVRQGQAAAPGDGSSLAGAGGLSTSSACAPEIDEGRPAVGN
ncbi:AAA family ATPase [Synechococcus sp. CS-1325]|uniref:AAA family ATPase n=1 Tax=Synechococcus sp. CS-1325 TaxID=2847979 RepID=UPI000DB835DD|nr:AAA family ATPase [Synechococcus sp. CS-1325]MCT0198502.1 AAA family ATPase [Synechococcus sp. CS-1325]PZV01381.1 MAG: AAA family ATPase [Cyanobium sp.]